MKPSSIKAGDVLYSVSRHAVGNTTVRGTTVYRVLIVSIEDSGWAVARWNGNEPRRYSPHDISRLRRSPPEWSGDWINGYRCTLCRRKDKDGHAEDCPHPKAVRARKAAAAKEQG